MSHLQDNVIQPNTDDKIDISYNDYRYRILGGLPTDWRVVKLGDIGQAIIGLTYSSSQVTDYGTLVLRSSNIRNGKLVYHDNVYVQMDLPNRVILQKDDILICVRNGSRQLIGKCAIIDEIAAGQAFGAFMSVFRTPFSSFVYYQFQSTLIQRQINEVMGATINQITNKDMFDFQIALPNNTYEQHAIAQVLNDIDQLITELESYLSKKQMIKIATMQQLLMGRTRLTAFVTNAAQKSDNLKKIPNDWQIVKLNELATISTGTKNNKDKVTDGLYPLYVRSENVERINSYSYDCEAILIPGEGGIGSIFHYIDGKFDAHQRVYILTDFQQCCGKYLYYQMQHSFGAHAKEHSVKATVDSLRLPTFLDYNVLLPPLEEQEAIAIILSDMDEEIALIQQKLLKIKNIKRCVMEALLTGRIRLPLSDYHHLTTIMESII